MRDARRRLLPLIDLLVLLALVVLPLLLAACQNGNTGGGGY
jgi:predicted small secreted protein